jgi:MFS transporter, putative metabolite:H+ symporter
VSANFIEDRLGNLEPLRMTAAVRRPGREMADISLDAQGVVQGGVAGGMPTAAPGHSKGDAQDWLSGIEKSNLTPRYYLTIGLFVLQEMFEFYDFFLVGYLVSVLAPSWHLTYGQSAMMLLSSGVGAIVGSLVGGMLADAFGRKMMVWGGGLIFSLGAAGCALIPDGAWILFSILRFVVGFGSIAAVSAQNPLIVEMTPTRYRTFVSSMMVAPVALGTMFAAMISASLLPVIGWRGVAATGAIPIVTSLLIAWIAPESVRWLLSRGRSADARREAAKLLGVPENCVTLPNAIEPTRKPGSLSELFQDQKRFWWVVVIWTGISTGTYGVILWGPTILSQLLKISAHEAAHYFVYASIASFLGRLLFSVLPLYIGRRGAALVGTSVSVLVMLAIVAFHHEFIAGWSVFALLVIFGAAFYSGSFSNMSPYVVEVFPVSLGGRAFGLAQAANGVGKILGPVCLALIAGSNDVVSPKATADAIAPAFLFLATCEFAALIAIFAYRREPHGKPMDIG